MPASGKKEVMSEAEIRQRVEAGQAAKPHGVYSVQARGEAAMTPSQRGVYMELQEQLSTRSGTVDALRDAAANTVMVAQVAQSYCVNQHQAGVPLDRIPLLRALPAFWNSANRALKAYLDVLPDESKVLDLAETIKQAMQEVDGDGQLS